MWCRGTCHEAKGRLEGTGVPPSLVCPHPWVCHLSSLGDQHLRDAQSNPTCRMRSIPCPVNLLFSPKEVQSPLREGHGGVCEQPSPLPCCSDNSHTGMPSGKNAQPPSQPHSSTRTSRQTPLFPSSFTTGTEDTKHEKPKKNRLFCAPHPPSPKHAGYLQAEASGSVAAAALAAGRLLAHAALGAVAAARGAAGAAAWGGHKS